METHVPPTVSGDRGYVVYARLQNICAWTQELVSKMVKRMDTHTLIAFSPELPVILPTPCTVMEYTPEVLSQIVARQTAKESGSVTLVWLVKTDQFKFDNEQETLFKTLYIGLRINMVIMDVSHWYGPSWKNSPDSIQADAVIDFACHGLCLRTQVTLPRPFTLVINDSGGILNKLRKSNVDGTLVVLTSMDRLRSWWEEYRQRPTLSVGIHVAVCMYHLHIDDPIVIELLTDTSLRKTVFVTHKNLQIMEGLPVQPDGVLFYCGYTNTGSFLKKKYVWEPFFSHEMDYGQFVGKCIMTRVADANFISTGHIPADLWC